MDLADLPSRNPEGWAVIDLMGHRRLVGYLQLVSVGNVAMLEVDQPEIRSGQDPRCKTPQGDPERVLLSAHKLLIHLQAVYSLTPVPDQVHCVNAFFDQSTAFGMAECPARWSPNTYEDDDDEENDDEYPAGYNPV